MTHLSAVALLTLQLVLVVPIPASNPPVTQPQPVDNADGLSTLPKQFQSPMDSLSTSHIPSSYFDSASGNSTRILSRGKRYLQFSKGSRMSWRTNGKNNLWTINTLYAYGYGFRANYPFPSIEEQKKDNAVFFRLFKRDLFSKLETALDGHGFDGRACMLKSFCTAINDVDNPKQKSGMLFKMLKLIFRRAKRYLDIIETTRIFFRVNVKNNVIKSPLVWAHGYGFRANTPVLVKRENRPFRRDTYELLHELIDRSGLDGRACVLKAYCTVLAGDHGQGFLFKLLKYVFTLDEHDKRHMPHLREENCEQIMHSHCPLSFDSISPYTDDV
uniref:GG12345 n=1 Tax=Drosophila erecta TaxID=7220 RepID=B3P736_DROER